MIRVVPTSHCLKASTRDTEKPKHPASRSQPGTKIFQNPPLTTINQAEASSPPNERRANNSHLDETCPVSCLSRFNQGTKRISPSEPLVTAPPSTSLFLPSIFNSQRTRDGNANQRKTTTFGRIPTEGTRRESNQSHSRNSKPTSGGAKQSRIIKAPKNPDPAPTGKTNQETPRPTRPGATAVVDERVIDPTTPDRQYRNEGNVMKNEKRCHSRRLRPTECRFHFRPHPSAGALARHSPSTTP